MPAPATAGLEGKFGYAITVPSSWYELEVHPALRDDSVRRLVEHRVRGNDVMWEQRNRIMKILRDAARSAYDAGATYCAAFAMPTEDGPVTGSVMVSLLEGPGLEGDGDLTGSLMKRFSPKQRGEDLEPYAVVGSVDIPTAGNCARVHGIEDVSLEGGKIVLRTVFMQTAILVPGHDRVFLVSAASPVVPLEAELLDVFDAVTGTFRLVTLDEGVGSEGSDDEGGRG